MKQQNRIMAETACAISRKTRSDGIILAAGRHLDASGENIKIPLGLGSRHRAAAGITSLTAALAIVVSEETGGVRIFQYGKIFMEIEKGE